jgi:cytochrome c peroxidase
MKSMRTAGLAVLLGVILGTVEGAAQIGAEKSIPQHLADGQEFQISTAELIAHGSALFQAAWTSQEGGGRPLTTGTGGPLSDPTSPLLFPRNFNRISAPDANSCAGCHAVPTTGGGGDIVANVFVLGQRFDFATFDGADATATRGSRDETGALVALQSIADERLTLGMFGSGFIEMLARQMTADLQAIRDATPPGGVRLLVAKGVPFGMIARNMDGGWVSSGVQGIPASSLVPDGSAAAPSLILRPFHQAGRVVSLREFSNNAFNHHHGIQSTERFGFGDADGDGFATEMTRADITAVSVFQATLPVPGRVIPRDRNVEAAVRLGERRFSEIGCAVCHVPSLPLNNQGWIFTEPNPFNPPGNLVPGAGVPVLSVDLTSQHLPGVRVKPDKNGVVQVPAYTDLKLHDITSGPADPNGEAIDMQHPPGSMAFFAGNRKFLTRKLWGAANEPPFFHHGKYTTLREATLAHAGEALASRTAFEALPATERDAVIEFLKSLQVLPEGAKSLVVDEKGNPRPELQ